MRKVAVKTQGNLPQRQHDTDAGADLVSPQSFTLKGGVRMIHTSESVSAGHPDKLCDQVSDGILDAYLREDPTARVAVETMATARGLVLAGEVASTAVVDRSAVARQVVSAIGYEDYSQLPIIDRVCKQSLEINAAVADGGAGDQGMMFGYATSETDSLMPAPLVIAQALRDEVTKLGWHPDAKTQVAVTYNGHQPVEVSRVVISACHPPSVPLDEVRETLSVLARRVLDKAGIPAGNATLVIQPSGAWTHGGPGADSGLTGRKIIVDTYGGAAPHGGGAFSGKDPSKVDRSGAYAARWVAKNVVAAGLAERALVELSYAIGVAEPITVRVSTDGTGVISDEALTAAVMDVFDLRPNSIIEELDLRSPRYLALAATGHFGNPDLPWEQVNRVGELKAATRGPWYDYDRGIGHEIHIRGTHEDGATWERELNSGLRETFRSGDAAFIAASRDWVPDALDRFDRLRNLHQPVRQHGCVPLCRDCLHQWPCETRRIIDGEGADQ